MREHQTRELVVNLSIVGFRDWEAMALMGQRSVGSTARPRNRNLPQTCWINFLPFWSRGGDVEGALAYCVRVPYLMGAVGNGTCCGAVGLECWNWRSALLT